MKGGFSDYFSPLISQKKHKLDLDYLELQNKKFLKLLENFGKEVEGLKKFEERLQQHTQQTRKEAAIFLSYLARTYLDAQLVFLSDENTFKDRLISKKP
jgi:hypothetical protein